MSDDSDTSRKGMPARRVGRAAFVASIFGMCGCIVVALLSLIPAVPPVPTAVLICLFIGLFPIHMRSILAWNRRPRSDAHQNGFNGSSQYWWLGWLVALAFAGFISAIPWLRGQPTAMHGRYYLNDHGSMIAVTHAAYRRGLAAQQRIFGCIPAVFYGLGVGLNRPDRPSEPR